MIKYLNMGRKQKRLNYYLIYTLLFTLTCLGVFFVYYSRGKSLIYDEDGWTQHYKALIYYSRYLRGIIANLFKTHSLVIPQWDFSIGEGAGIIETFHYYAIGDPIAFLVSFFSDEYVYVFYNLSVILRLYLSGVVFSELCFYLKKDNYYAIMAGSFVYAFCYWNLFNSSRHIYFLNPMIYFPLIIIGVEKIFNDEKPYIFLIAVFVSALSNFYFFYNIVILTVLYVAVRLLIIYKTNVKLIVSKLIPLFKYSIISVLMSCIILAPIIFVFLNDTRAGVSFERHLIYPFSYYIRLPMSFITSVNRSWLCMGFAAPVILGLISSIKDYKKNISILAFEIISLIFILVPLFGQFMNGNTYVANKWCFSLALLVAYIFVDQWNNIKDRRNFIKIVLLMVLGIYAVYGLQINIIIPVVICLIFFVIQSYVGEHTICGLSVKQSILIFLVITNIIFVSNYHYSEIGTNYSSNATTFEEDKNIYYTNEAYFVSNYMDNNDDDFVRFSGSNLSLNSSTLYGKSSTSFFWSLSNPNISQYRKDLDLNGYSVYSYKEYDKRFILNSLANVKYYVTDKDYTEMIPFGFSLISDLGPYNIYINENTLPFGYTYEKAISYDDWKELSSTERELSLTKAVVLENTNNSEKLVNNIDKVVCNVESSEGLTYHNGYMEVFEKNAVLNLSFKAKLDKISYLGFEGLMYNDSSPWIKHDSANKERTNIRISLNNHDTELAIYADSDRMYNERDSYLINVSDYIKENNILKLVFEETGIYNLNEISINSYDANEYIEELDNLKNNHLENVIFNKDHIQGNIYCEENEYLLLSIPYSNGWKAYVDGEEKELLKANVAYMALELNQGYHEIELFYETPLLKEGAIISVIGIVLLVIDIAIRKKKNDK